MSHLYGMGIMTTFTNTNSRSSLDYTRLFEQKSCIGIKDDKFIEDEFYFVQSPILRYFMV